MPAFNKPCIMLACLQDSPFVDTNNAGAGFGESRPCLPCLLGPECWLCCRLCSAVARCSLALLSSINMPAVGDKDLVRISIMNYESDQSSGEPRLARHHSAGNPAV
jgi:hypothetical protein